MLNSGVERTEDAIPLEAELTLSELRDEKIVGSKLREFHRVRIRRYREIVGVLLDRTEWQRLIARIVTLEDQVAEFEEAALRALVAKRARGSFEAGSPGRAETIFDEADAALAARSGE